MSRASRGLKTRLSCVRALLKCRSVASSLRIAWVQLVYSSWMGPKLNLIKTLWGIDEPISSALFRSIHKEGYAGVEVIKLAWNSPESEDLLVESLNDAKLSVVCQLHTCGGYIQNNEYIYCGAFDVELHKKDFEKQLQECQNLISKVDQGGFVNVHGGLDAWTMDEAVEFLAFCLNKIEGMNPNMLVTFETHRQRLFGSPFQTRDLLQQYGSNKLAKLKLNADLSHWYVACERVFDPKEPRDAAWWPSLLEIYSKHCWYIHSRFGWSQGPQMADPSVIECSVERQLQEDTWKLLLQSMVQRDANATCYVEPEYGPPPYLPVHPATQEPVASLPAAVSYTKGRIETIFSQI